MAVQFNKNGVISSDNIYESSGMNLVQQDQINKIFKYTPTTGNNSCMQGFTVDYSNCKPGEKIYCRIKVEWNGFDESNTDGTFDMRFQGSNYNNITNVWEWKGTSLVANALNLKQPLKTLVLSKTSGTAIIISDEYTIPSDFPDPYIKGFMGIRTDYSNGTGWIAISELEVVQEKYYTSENTDSVLRISKNNFISCKDIIEI